MIASLIASTLVLALTRAEIIERMRAPIFTRADGMVKVFAACPEDMRREFQSPVARFAADTVQTLWQGLGKRPVRYSKPAIKIYVGDMRTNNNEVIVRFNTNDVPSVTRLYLKAPGFADLYRFRVEIIKAFYREVQGRELTDAESVSIYRKAVPRLRIEDARLDFENWFLHGKGEYDDGLRMMRHIVEPGCASPLEVMIFASRLYLYPPAYDLKFLGKYHELSFREAIEFADKDPMIRIMAELKAPTLPIFGSGRGDELTLAVYAYMRFLNELADDDSDKDELTKLLDDADEKLAKALEKATKTTRSAKHVGLVHSLRFQ